MSLHPHLPGIVKACAGHPDMFMNLISMVSQYMHVNTVIFYLLFPWDWPCSSGSKGRRHSKTTRRNLVVDVPQTRPENGRLPRFATARFTQPWQWQISTRLDVHWNCVPPLPREALRRVHGGPWVRQFTFDTTFLSDWDARLFMEQVCAGVRRIDPHDIPHFCYCEGSVHDEDEYEEYDELEGLFGGFLLERVSTSFQEFWFIDYFLGSRYAISLVVQNRRSILSTAHQGQRQDSGVWVQ